MDFSFVIPAFNEAGNIRNVIASIAKYVPSSMQYEIIVVDHGSADETVNIAEKVGAKVIVHPSGTIAGLRNLGVAHSQGKILVFLDADILLTEAWQSNIVKVVSQVSDGVRLLTGSWCCVPDNPNWLEKYWFKPLQKGDNSHINSGHLIISRKLFEEINGFDEKLETGEDYDISVRAKASNIQLFDDAALKVVHEGYPKNVYEFAKREYWHGKGDVASLVTLFQSKVALVGLLFVALHFALLFFSVVGSIEGVYLSVASVVCIVVGMAIMKYKAEPVWTIMVNAFIYYVYFWARGLSTITSLGSSNVQKRTR